MNTRLLSLIGLGCFLCATVLHAANNVPPNVPKNIRYTAAPGACQPFTAADAPKLAFRHNALALINIHPWDNARAACAPNVDVSDNGDNVVGLYIGNNDGGTMTQQVTCTATYNTAGQGAKQITKTVTVYPNTIQPISWATADFIAFGGPVSFICNLKPRTSVMRVFTLTQTSS